MSMSQQQHVTKPSRVKCEPVSQSQSESRKRPDATAVSRDHTAHHIQ
jgi:hypothetical protein